MQKAELKNKILKVLNDYPVGSVATIKDGVPWVRYMAMQSRDDLTLFTASFASARKIDQIRKNNAVHICFGHDPKIYNLPYVNIQGTAEILTDPESKKNFWSEPLKQFFTGPDDPNYIVIKVTPTTIEYMDSGAHEPQIFIP